jgi:hypothetical protein
VGDPPVEIDPEQRHADDGATARLATAPDPTDANAFAAAHAPSIHIQDDSEEETA